MYMYMYASPQSPSIATPRKISGQTSKVKAATHTMFVVYQRMPYSAIFLWLFGEMKTNHT